MKPTDPTPIPMPGRLSVERFDELLRQVVSVPLAEVPAGAQIIATTTVSRVRHLDPGRFGRVMLTLTGDDGQWAFASVGPDVFDRFGALLLEGARVVVRGTAVAADGNVPASISCRNVRPFVVEPVGTAVVSSTDAQSSSDLTSVAPAASVLTGVAR